MEIEDLIREYGAYIFRYAMKLSCHPQKAEDIAQETFIQAWKNLNHLKEEQAIKKMVAYNLFQLFSYGLSQK